MSYDRILICPSTEQKSWVERDSLHGRSTASFFAAFELLQQQGWRVALSHGENLGFEELYLFLFASDAEDFYRAKYNGRQFLKGGGPEVFGFQDISLYMGSILVARKSLEAGVERHLLPLDCEPLEALKRMRDEMHRRVEWDDVRCNRCPQPASHVCVEETGLEDPAEPVAEHVAYCDECYAVKVSGTVWIHWSEDQPTK